MTRRDRLILLLGSWHDFLPSPKGSLRTVAGLAPGRRVVCPDCGFGDRRGFRVDRFKRSVPCETCGGRFAGPGVRAKRGRGFVAVDAMDADRQPIRVEHGDVGTKPAPTKLCDSCGGTGVGGAHLDETGREFRAACDRCAGSGRRSVAVFDLALEPDRGDADTAAESAIERRAAAGSYFELDRALAELRSAWPSLYRAVVSAYVDGDEEARKLRLVEVGLVFLERRLPDPIRVPAGVVRAAKLAKARRALAVGRGAGRMQIEKRDKEIRSLIRQGRPSQWVAAEYGLSVSTVNRICSLTKEAA